jgi:hydrogenase assembly chaperone HypC/HupF
MCIGVPLQVVRAEGESAWCEAETHDGLRAELLDMRLVGEQAVGTWVLGFMGAARQVLSETEARQALDARGALSAVLAGSGNVDAFFADLVGREPQLPAHLLEKL